MQVKSQLERANEDVQKHTAQFNLSNADLRTLVKDVQSAAKGIRQFNHFIRRFGSPTYPPFHLLL